MSYDPNELEGSHNYQMKNYKYAEQHFSDNEIFDCNGDTIEHLSIRTTQRYSASTEHESSLERKENNNN